MAIFDLDKLEKSTNIISNSVPNNLIGIEWHTHIGKLIQDAEKSLRLELIIIFERLLSNMIRMNASDIDVGGPGCAGKIWYRVYGNKTPVKFSKKIPYSVTDILLNNILNSSQRKLLFKNKNIDFSYSLDVGSKKKIRFRADMYFDLGHLALNMRKIDNYIRPFKSLGVHNNVAKVVSLRHFKYGLTLITGITGAGKSSTLDTIIDANNRSIDAHIVIIGSPIELIHEPVRCVVRHREVGIDVHSYKEGAINALRQDPDIIVISELRDSETIITALEITDSGHKIFGTLHTSSAIESIERILGEVSPAEQNRVRNRLSDVLNCVISQKLVPSTDGKLILAKEVLLVTPSVQAAIRNNNIGEIYQMLMEGKEKGMNTMEQDLKRLFNEGKITKETALNNSNNKTKMLQLLGEIGK